MKIYIILLAFCACFVIFIFRTYLSRNNSIKKNKNGYYKYYTQDNNYKIKENNIGKEISLDDIINNIDYDALRNGDIICCGIEKDGDFVEISFDENKYQLRIFKNGKEKMETIDDNATINDIVYNYVKYGTDA